MTGLARRYGWSPGLVSHIYIFDTQPDPHNRCWSDDRAQGVSAKAG